MQSSTGTKNLKNQDTILDVTSGSHFVGDSLVSDTIDKKLLGGCQRIVWLASLTNLNLSINFHLNSITFLGRIREVSFKLGVCNLLNYKVLSGKMRTATYLDSEQGLVRLF
ncbi:hypothetical protein H5410_008353 [Solanum commersonii]|uniref:Uncharacterized protein n=1 Tax=Solanum commersonii TaxID=4109 RepID=A0A9J6AGJ4_SOLCO|nr:hypothetical protein H5410_008353 [Solanum commersonii]